MEAGNISVGPTGELPTTREERLLEALLRANEELAESLKIYDEYERLGVETEVERSTRERSRVETRGNSAMVNNSNTVSNQICRFDEFCVDSGVCRTAPHLGKDLLRTCMRRQRPLQALGHHRLRADKLLSIRITYHITLPKLDNHNLTLRTTHHWLLLWLLPILFMFLCHYPDLRSTLRH